MRAQKEFSISHQMRLWSSSLRVHVSGAQCTFWRTNKFVFLDFWPWDLLFWRDEQINQNVIWDAYCPTYPTEKCAHLSTNNLWSPKGLKSAKLALTSWIFFSRTKNWQICCIVVTVHIDWQEKRVATMEKEIHLLFGRSFSTDHIQVQPNLSKKTKTLSIYCIFTSTPLWLMQLIEKSFPFSF